LCGHVSWLQFCPGSFTEKEALEAAMRTWPPGIRPIVHWSESQAGRKPHAHSDYVQGPIFLHGYEGQVEVMIEAKCKVRLASSCADLCAQVFRAYFPSLLKPSGCLSLQEQALLAVRGDIPIPPPVTVAEEPPITEEQEVALKLLE
jgi:UV DNA damage endonuclease